MDFYTALAAEVLGKPYELVTPYERERAKKYWYARLYDGNTNLRYINTFLFETKTQAEEFLTTVSYDKLPIARMSAGLFVLEYNFDNPHDAYINLCEAHSSNVPLVSVDCKTEMPE